MGIFSKKAHIYSHKECTAVGEMCLCVRVYVWVGWGKGWSGKDGYKDCISQSIAICHPSVSVFKAILLKRR